MRTEFKETILSLIRLGIGHYTVTLPKNIDWNVVETVASQQGLLAIIVDGIEKISESQRPPKTLLLEWIGKTFQGYEQRYSLYERAIAELASFYNANGFKMMVLKGYACSLDWPKPAYRPCGDIDIWQFGQQKDADIVLKRDKNIKVDTSHHHHTVFVWRGFTVENHYDFINVYAHKSSANIEKLFKILGEDDTHFVDVKGEKVYLPSPNLHALFLIRHMVSHFAAAEISLRHVLDWAFFVEKHSKEVDWIWMIEVLEMYHMKSFFNCINAISIEDLGFSSSFFPTVQYLPSLKEKILNDILDPEFTSAEPKKFLTRLVFKYRRWQGNAWKQKLCYNESRWFAFWCGIWSRILKPTSI